MTQKQTKSEKSFIFIFDGPVSCSKLFGRLLSTHPQLKSIHGYPYLLAASRGPNKTPARLTPATEQRLVSKWQNEVKEEDLNRWALMTFEQANQSVTESIVEIQQLGKIAVVQEHAALCIKADISLGCLRNQSVNFEADLRQNPTIIDDGLIRSCIPIILIRHPALYIPSMYRKQRKEDMLDLDDEMFQLWVSLQWVRILYDYFANIGGSGAPFVIDAEDVVHHTRDLAHKLGAIFDIDPDGIRETWDTSSNEPVPEGVVASFHERLRNSTGVERDDMKVLDGDIDLEERTQSWKAEFGDEIGQEIRHRVDGEMPAYMFLRGRKL